MLGGDRGGATCWEGTGGGGRGGATCWEGTGGGATCWEGLCACLSDRDVQY